MSRILLTKGVHPEPLAILLLLITMPPAFLGAFVQQYSKLLAWILIAPFVIYAITLLLGVWLWLVGEAWRELRK